MADETDLLTVADALAEIARTTTDAATGKQIMALVTSMLEAAGLPPDGLEPGVATSARLTCD